MYSEKHHAIILLNKNMEAQEGLNPDVNLDTLLPSLWSGQR